MANPNATPPDSGFKDHPERINLSGRPRKWVSTLRDLGYKKSEVNDCLQVLLASSTDELKEIEADEKNTALERVVAKAILEGHRKGTLYNIETLLTRVYGQPKQEVEAQLNITKFDVKFNDTDNLPEK